MKVGKEIRALDKGLNTWISVLSIPETTNQPKGESKHRLPLISGRGSYCFQCRGRWWADRQVYFIYLFSRRWQLIGGVIWHMLKI